jgi:hypothetical protein
VNEVITSKINLKLSYLSYDVSMKDNHKTLMKISLGLMIAGFGLIKSATTAELRSVGSSEPTASNAETAGDVSQTVHITLLNLAGEELGSYTVGRNDTLAELNKNGYFLLPGRPAKLDQSRTIGDIVQSQDPTVQSDVLTLEYVPSPTFRLDLSLLNTNDLPEFRRLDLLLDPTFTYERRTIIMDNRRKCREYVKNKLGLPKDRNIKMDLLACRPNRLNRVLLYVTNGDNLEFLYNVPINEVPRVSYYGTMDPIIFKMFKAGDDIPVFLNGSLNAKFGKVVENKPSTDNSGCMVINCDNNFYRCVYIDNEYVVVSIRNEPVTETQQVREKIELTERQRQGW